MRRFRGEAENKVDSKGRVSIPAPFRRVLEEGDPDWSNGVNPNFVIVYGRRNSKCLEGYSLKSMNDVDEEWDSFTPETNLQKRMKDVIARIETREKKKRKI